MTTLENRPNTALLVVDVQNGLVGGAHERDAVVADVGTLVERARRERVPVVWVQHSDRLVVVGAQTDACIRSTLHGAFVRGYDATLISDAHTTEDQTARGAPPPDQVIAHTNLYWTYQTAPGRTAGTIETKDVDFAGPS
ncbi:MAG: isochorismatase family protein [Acidimicrobiia bacterium]